MNKIFSLSAWLTARITRRIVDDWQSMRVKHIIDFILNEIHLQGTKVSARLVYFFQLQNFYSSIAKTFKLFSWFCYLNKFRCLRSGSAGKKVFELAFSRFSQQLTITEIEFSGIDQRSFVQEQLNINLSSEAIKEREVLRSIDRLLSKKSVKVCGFFHVSKQLVITIA